MDAELLATGNPECEIVSLDILDHPPEDAHLALLDALRRHNNPAPVHLVGFSLGTLAAINIAARRPDLVARMTLISPAAPLQLGNFLPEMAGKLVFTLALRAPLILRMLTKAQAFAAAVAPNVLINLLFAKAGPAERDLLGRPEFRNLVRRGLRHSLGAQQSSYLRYIAAYVDDWTDQLEAITCPVALWHGDADTWSPPQMSDALKRKIPARTQLHIVPSGEHYGTMARTKLGTY